MMSTSWVLYDPIVPLNSRDNLKRQHVKMFVQLRSLDASADSRNLGVRMLILTLET